MTTPNVQVAFATPMRRFIIAMISGALAVLFLYYYIDRTLLETSGGERIPVLVATKVLRPGERVDGEGIAVQQIPRAYFHTNSVKRDDQDKVVGRKVYRHIAANQPILWSDFDAPESERATLVALTKGMRAYAVSTGEALRKARILKLGDVVDVLFHFALPQNQGSVAVTLFQRVVIIDQRDEVAVLALTPEQAEQMAFAQAHGQSTIVLRNREDTEQKDLKQVSFPNLLSGYIDLRSAPGTTNPAANVGKNEALLQLIEQAKQQRAK